jgi:hypothetical protein
VKTWSDVGRQLGAPGVEGRNRVRDPGVGRALLGALIVGALWAQGGLWRTLAGAILIAAVAAPGPDGKSLLQLSAEGLRSLLSIWLDVEA